MILKIKMEITETRKNFEISYEFHTFFVHIRVCKKTTFQAFYTHSSVRLVNYIKIGFVDVEIKPRYFVHKGYFIC